MGNHGSTTYHSVVNAVGAAFPKKQHRIYFFQPKKGARRFRELNNSDEATDIFSFEHSVRGILKMFG